MLSYTMKIILLQIIATAALAATGFAQADIPTKSIIELKPVSYSVGWADMLVNTSIDGHAVLLDGQPCAEYILAHAPSSLVYDIPPGATHFTAIGISPQGLPNPGTWTYTVKIDRKVVFESRSLQSYSNKQVPIEVAIPKGAKRMELITDEMKDAYSDHSIWAKPRFEARPASKEKK